MLAQSPSSSTQSHDESFARAIGLNNLAVKLSTAEEMDENLIRLALLDALHITQNYVHSTHETACEIKVQSVQLSDFAGFGPTDAFYDNTAAPNFSRLYPISFPEDDREYDIHLEEGIAAITYNLALWLSHVGQHRHAAALFETSISAYEVFISRPAESDQARSNIALLGMSLYYNYAKELYAVNQGMCQEIVSSFTECLRLSRYIECSVFRDLGAGFILSTMGHMLHFDGHDDEASYIFDQAELKYRMSDCETSPGRDHGDAAAAA